MSSSTSGNGNGMWKAATVVIAALTLSTGVAFAIVKPATARVAALEQGFSQVVREFEGRLTRVETKVDFIAVQVSQINELLREQRR